MSYFWELIHGYGIFGSRLECWGTWAFSEDGPKVQTARNYHIKCNLLKQSDSLCSVRF